MSLPARLFATYLLLITITLGVMVAALVLLLNARPAPPQQTYQRLAAIAQGFTIDEVIGGISPRNFANPQLRRQAIEDELTTLAAERNVRILIADPEDSTVIYDSAAIFAEGSRLSWQLDPYILPSSIGRGFNAPVETIFGSFTNPDGDQWLFFGLSARSRRISGALLFADPYENQSLQQALADFGSSLALPLCQSAAVGLLIASALAVYGTRGITRSLRMLARASTDVAAGNYNQRVPLDGPPEVRAVAESFNEMAAQVRTTHQAQQDFVANVSHDLKTPLTSIQGFSQAIIDGAAHDPVQAAQIIYEEAGRLNRMVTQLTDLARLQAGRLSMNLTAVDVGQIAQAVAQRLSIVAQEKGMTMHIDAHPLPSVAGDGDRLAQVLTNLISNAIKYTPEGGDIFVQTRAREDGVEVIVRDTGIGVAPEDLPRIFERFYQVDKARGPERGTGLGLAIVREIVQSHGGRISVASAGKGKGTTFTLWLPAPHLPTVVRPRR
jgi:histidine kinase